MTSSPIMNKKKMFEALQDINANQLEQDKLNTFQTPLPQLRMGLQKKTDGKIDSRLQKLVGILPKAPIPA